MRRTAIVLACLGTLAAGCSSGRDGTDITGRSAATAPVTPREAAPTTNETGVELSTPAAETTPAGPATFAMGQKGTITNEDVGDILYVTIAQPRTVRPDEFNKPEQGRFLAVTVTFEALAAAQDVNPFDFIAVTASGERLDPAFAFPDGVGAELRSATLNTGEKARGSVLFDVPAKGVTGIAYAPAGQVIGTWKLA